MARKSKVITFLLSFIPGLGHFYLNHFTRGLIFFLATAGVVGFSYFYMLLTRYYTAPLPLLLLPIIWLVAMVDSMVLVDRINEQQISNGQQLQRTPLDEAELNKQNRKLIAMVVSVVPGAGHMYLGFQRQGLQLMAIFFFTIFFSDWLMMSFLMFIVPIVWFYSLFDTLQKATSEETMEDRDIMLVSWLKGESEWEVTRHKFLGYGLITLGLILIFNRITFPAIARYIDWQLSQYLQTGLVALLFIVGGVKIIKGGKLRETAEFPEKEESQQLDSNG